MSTLFLNNSITEDLLTCRTCLTTERKLFSIHEYNISEAYKNLIGNEASPYDGLPQYICNYCSVLLVKFNIFRRNVHQTLNYLQDTKIITPNLLSTYHPISLNTTPINTTDSTEDVDIKKEEDQDLGIPFTTESELTLYSNDIPDEITDNLDTENKTSKLKVNKSNFESDFRVFEQDFNVKVLVLSAEEQKNDMLERKLGNNYIQSPYKCDLCYKGVMDEESLKKHYLYQHDPSRGAIICELCSFRYKDKRGLNQHVKKSHRLKFACRQCSYVSRTTFNAKEHYKMHTGHIHKCRHCGKSYEKLSSHLTHLRIHHPSEFIWCDICGEAFIGQFGLNAHKKKAHRDLALPFDCTSCDVHFKTDTALNKHKISNNCVNSSCVHCGESFTKEMELREHLIHKHRISKVYECEKCEKKFTRQSLHSAHYKRAHVDKDKRKAQKPWICEVCGKTLPNRCILLYHQRNHSGERPYQCTQCTKSFTMKRLLQSHLRVHSTARPYTCKLCPKAFKGLSALRSHEHVHVDSQKSPRNRKT